MRIADNTPKIGRGIIRHPRPKNNSLSVLLFKQSQHILQREGAAHVGIEDEEAVWSAFKDCIPEVVETPGGPEGLVFAEVFYADGGVGAGAVFHEVPEDAFVVVADDEDFADFGDFGYGGEAVGDYWVACQAWEVQYGLGLD